jgi:hypothetical protein
MIRGGDYTMAMLENQVAEYLELCTLYTFPGDCRDDNRRRLHHGHAGEPSSRVPDVKTCSHR